jgi:hypothetical protein
MKEGQSQDQLPGEHFNPFFMHTVITRHFHANSW